MKEKIEIRRKDRKQDIGRNRTPDEFMNKSLGIGSQITATLCSSPRLSATERTSSGFLASLS